MNPAQRAPSSAQPQPSVLVNGISCKLQVDADQLAWWPSSDCDDQNPNSCPSELKALANKQRVEFSQVVGIKRAVTRSNGDKKFKLESSVLNIQDLLASNEQDDDDSEQRRTQTKAAQIKRVRNRLNKNKTTKLVRTKLQRQEDETTTKEPTTNSEQQQQQNNQLNGIKLKIYYAKRSETKTSGRLMKVKKISIRLDEESQLLGQQIEQAFERHQQLRPKRLLIFVNPFGGKGRALQLYKLRVKRLLELANVEAKLVVTKYANHARDTIEDPLFDVEHFDGIICIGGDGMFSELMNGLLFRCNRDKILTNELNLLELKRRLSENGALAHRDVIRPSSSGEIINSFVDDDDDEGVGDDDDYATMRKNKQQQQQVKAIAAAAGDTRTRLVTQNNSAIVTTNNGDDQSKSGQEILSGDNKINEQRQLSKQQRQFEAMRQRLGGVGEQFRTPSIPIGVIGAGSTDCNAFGLLGTNDVITATLNIILGNQIQVDVCSIHSIRSDRLLRFVSTFIAYGYFGDVIRESERYRWLGPSRYDLTGLNTLLKNQTYNGRVRILRSRGDGTPNDTEDRCHLNCSTCDCSILAHHQQEQKQTSDSNQMIVKRSPSDLVKSMTTETNKGTTVTQLNDHFEFIEKRGPFVGVNAAVMACRCPQTRKGFSPSNHLANGCADLILVSPCTRVQYVNYLLRTGFSKKSAFDLKYVDAYRCRQFEFLARDSEEDVEATAGGDDDEDSSDDHLSADDQHYVYRHSNHHQRAAREQQANNNNNKKLSSSCGSDSLISSQQSSNSNSLDAKQQHQQQQSLNSISSTDQHLDHELDLANGSTWNADGEILTHQSIRVKVNNRLLRVFGTGEPRLMK